MNKKINWWLGSGVSIEAEYAAILARASSRGFAAPSAAQQIKQKDFLRSLKAGGVLQVLDWLYITLNNVGVDFGRINCVAPTTFETTGSPTWTSNQGVKSAASSFLNTTWLYANRINYSQNSGCVFAYVFTDGNDGAAAIGSLASGTDRMITLQTRDASNRVAGVAINAGAHTTGSGGTLTSDVGLHLVNRVDSGNQTHYRNNVQTATGAVASITPTDQAVYLLARNLAGVAGSFFIRDISIFGCGAGLNSAQRTVLYNACATYVATPE